MRIGLGIGLNRFRGGQAGVVGLLDAYKGSAFAMSPDTLLYSTYSATDDVAGSVTNGDPGQWSVTVYRDSDNAMRSFTAAEVADGTANTWREAAGAANGLVRRAYDQSVTALDVSNLNHADQSDPTKMPKLFDSSTGLIVENGKAAMQFDGTNDFLKSPASFTQPFTYFVVSKMAASTVDRTMLDGDAGTNFVQLKYFDQQERFILFAGANPVDILSGNTFNTNQNLHYALYNGLNSEIALNNGVENTGNVGTNNPTAITIGARLDGSGQFWNDKIQSTVLYDSNQSTNRSAISGLINTEYNNIY